MIVLWFFCFKYVAEEMAMLMETKWIKNGFKMDFRRENPTITLF